MNNDKQNSEYEVIPAWEWGEGCKIDWINSRLIGVSGVVYENVRIKGSDLNRLIEETLKKRKN